MVEISQKDFNRDMDSYLAKKTEYDNIKRPEKKETNSNSKKKKKGIFTKVVDVVSGDDVVNMNEEIVDDVDEYEEIVEKKGFFSGIKSWFLNEDDVEDIESDEEEFEEKLPDDLKDILKIQNKWLKKLPAKDMKKFKSSSDYEVYKEVLIKYGLIK